jgi:hypothetical protein
MNTMTMTIPVKDFYCSQDANREKPENDIKGERLEPLTAGGSFKPADQVPLHHDIFFEDVILYTDPNDKETSRLIRDVDYELEDEDSIATDQSGWRCYQKIKILKAQTAIYADYWVYGDFIDCNIFNQQIALSKDAREDITSLQKSLTSAQDKLNNHEPRIATAENSIRSNLGKINHNAQEIEGAKTAISQNVQRIENTKTELTGMIQQERLEREKNVEGMTPLNWYTIAVNNGELIYHLTPVFHRYSPFFRNILQGHQYSFHGSIIGRKRLSIFYELTNCEID